jgi:hypothetical protein
LNGNDGTADTGANSQEAGVLNGVTGSTTNTVNHTANTPRTLVTNNTGNNTQHTQAAAPLNNVYEYMRKKENELKQHFTMYNQYLANLYDDIDRIIKSIKENNNIIV